MFAPQIAENVNGRASFVIVVVERWASFIAFMTGKMFRPRADLDLDFNDRKVDQSFGKRINACLTNFHCLFFLNTNVSKWGVTHFEQWNFWIQICLFGFICLLMQKGWRTNCRKPHLNWSYRSWEIWIYSWVMRFFISFFFNLIIDIFIWCADVV